MKSVHNSTRSWLAVQGRLGRAAAWPVLALSGAGTLVTVLQTVLLGAGLAGLLFGTPPGIRLLLLFGGLAVLRAALSVMSERHAFEAGASARRRLRSEVLGRLLTIGPQLLRTQHSAELAAIVVDRIEALDGYFARWLPAAFMAIFGPLLVMLAAVWLEPWAALVLGACGLLVPIAMALSGIGAAAASRRQLVALQRLQVRFLDRVRGIATIVMAGRAAAEAEAIALAAEELRQRTMRVLRVAFLSSAALDCAAAAALVLLALRFTHQLAAPNRNVGDVARALAVLLLVPEFFAPLRVFAAAYQDRSQATAAADALAALPAPLPAADLHPVRTVQARGLAVTFENVSLRWDPARAPALDDISFRLAAGETLVLAGPSGAGKSSLIEILLGFVQPTAGRVTLNGADIASLVPQALSKLTAWIGQQPMLFAASIEENIRFARPEAGDVELAAAIAFARLDSVIDSLPDGLRTQIGEGGFGLSGGQAQRVAIARAFLKNAPLLLLDEPTSHLDPATETDVLDSLRRLAVGRTVVIASHAAAAHAFGGRRLDLRHGRVVPSAGTAQGIA